MSTNVRSSVYFDLKSGFCIGCRSYTQRQKLSTTNLVTKLPGHGYVMRKKLIINDKGIL